MRRLPHGVVWQTATLLVTGLRAHAAGAVEHGPRLAHLAAGAGGGRGAAPARARTIAAALLGLGTWVGAGPLMFAFLNGSGTCLLAWGLLPEASRARFSWVGWFVAAAPLALVVALGSLVLLRVMFRPEPVAQLPLQRVRLQVAVLGPGGAARDGRDRHPVLTVAGWVAAPWLGVDLATDRAARPAGHRGARHLRPAALQSLDWSFLIFFGVVLTVGRLGVAVGLDRAAAATVDRLLGPPSPGRCCSCWRWPA